MTKKKYQSQFLKLQKIGIRHFDELIHDQKKEWLIKHFKKGSDEYPVNVARLIRNIIWQMRERILKKEKPLLNELIRTFWYMYIKATLSRAGALSHTRDQYNDMIEQFVFLVMKQKIMKYKDFGFRDENEANRQVGINAHIVIVAEKAGHAGFLKEIHEQYQVSTIALGGQPSALTSEYFVRELKKSGVDIRRSFYLFTIVDYDPSGWIIRNAFIKNLYSFGIKNVKYYDLINPDMLKSEEIILSKYSIPSKKLMHKKNKAWLKEIQKLKYKNQQYLGSTLLSARNYGLEAESVSTKRIAEKLKEVMVPLLGKSERLLRIHQIEQAMEIIKEMMMLKLIWEAE